MRISVLIPTYNSAPFIEMTLQSVLQQTSPPEEILVLDDGSTDHTLSILNAYEPRVTVLQQQNQGVAAARNALCARASGDLLAFLDHDDLWHPRYLEVQRRLFAECPNAVASFTGHVNFDGYAGYPWNSDPADPLPAMEVIEPLTFFQRYNKTTGLFGSMSFCCLPKRILGQLDSEPFSPQLAGVDDSYLCTLLPLFGSVAYGPTPLVAYRVTRAAQSVNRVKSYALWVDVFRLLEERYTKAADPKLLAAFRLAYASRIRQYAKVLMGAGRVSEARDQFRCALRAASHSDSVAKSLALLFLTYLPPFVQPAWPSSSREVRNL